ncbi:lysophospholipase [Paenibacillus sp. BSR1-1]|uniref:alpha/beta hydrolase n=1 Tax=Paenibacillus sp. BSR1-1 TaxID=3020845 RepID=UPI0025B16BC5|nr:alpha/beta hydrolase [Paenibacillus sp. BSR1-1]MDN3018876.1 lysophospholipase [Paenibacillus sp. BSR1-1]
MSQPSSFTFQTEDGVEIFAKKWASENENRPKVIVQIAHGMAEHIERYDAFAKELMTHDFIVYGNDHRGHGETAKINNRSRYFADEQGFKKVVEDMHELTIIIEKEFPGIPIILFGHSMGSFLSRRYIQLYGNQLSGVILSGTGGDPGIMGKIGKWIASREKKRKGAQTPSLLLNNLTFGSYNKSFKPTRTEFDWLSREEREVDKYIEDPMCGGIFSAGFFYDLLEGIAIINKRENLRRIPANLPIFLISGARDPVGNNSKGVLKTYKAYKQVGIKEVSYKLYEDARHELLNEKNREEVQADIIRWITLHI